MCVFLKRNYLEILTSKTLENLCALTGILFGSSSHGFLDNFWRLNHSQTSEKLRRKSPLLEIRLMTTLGLRFRSKFLCLPLALCQCML